MAEEEPDTSEKRGVYFFGRDISQIPCFRNSFLYGITGGLTSGLLYFMFTSKVPKATNVGYGSFLITTLSYWFYCRYNYSKNKLELMKSEYFLKQRIASEGVGVDYDKNNEFKSPVPDIELPETFEK